MRARLSCQTFVGRYVGTLLSSLEPAQRFQPRIKRYPQQHTVRGMDSELWRRRRRPIRSVRHVLTTAAPCLLPACSERVNQVLSRLCASARVGTWLWRHQRHQVVPSDVYAAQCPVQWPTYGREDDLTMLQTLHGLRFHDVLIHNPHGPPFRARVKGNITNG